MSEQLQQYDLRIVQESDNRFHVYQYVEIDRELAWGRHRIFDLEGIANFTEGDALQLERVQEGVGADGREGLSKRRR